MDAKFGILVLGVFVNGCATVIDGGYQDVYIKTSCKDEVVVSSCTISNEFFSWEINTPSYTRIHRGKKDLVLVCSSDRFNKQKLAVSSKANIPMYTNFIYGGGVGAILDNNDGSGFNYPSQINFKVKGCATVSWTEK
jgi:hypothetical protein